MIYGDIFNWKLVAVVISIIVDIICIKKLNDFSPSRDYQLVVWGVTIVSGLIIYGVLLFTVWGEYGTIMMPNEYGQPEVLRIGLIAVAAAPGLLVMTIISFFRDELPYRKKSKKEKR